MALRIKVEWGPGWKEIKPLYSIGYPLKWVPDWDTRRKYGVRKASKIVCRIMHEVATSLSNGCTHKLTFRDMLFSKPVPLSLPIIGLQGLRTATEQTASVLTGSDRMHAHTSHSLHGSLDVRFVAVDLPHYLRVYFRLKCEWQGDPCSLPTNI